MPEEEENDETLSYRIKGIFFVCIFGNKRDNRSVQQETHRARTRAREKKRTSPIEEGNREKGLKHCRASAKRDQCCFVSSNISTACQYIFNFK